MKTTLLKLSVLLLILNLAATALIAVSARTALAQEKLDLRLPMFIWNSYVYHADTSNYDNKTYVFTIDHSQVDGANLKPVTNLVVQTNIGNIIFNDPINFQSPAFINGKLITARPVVQFNITKVLGLVDGKQVDLTENFRAPFLSPVPIEVMTSETAACPRTVMNFQVYQGTFKALEVGDFQQAEIESNGKSEYFFFDDSVSYFFENEANVNKKVKVFVENVQTIISDGENSDCGIMDSIIKFIEIK
ncbi:MAG: hypothetical protein LBQ12_02745 [Deltaproteobacteria bacterium]|jgi:hypothetical protein|nr:hypothetical protein [Deltaproteobacteria bacterium]